MTAAGETSHTRIRAVLQLHAVYGNDRSRLNDLLGSMQLAGVELHQIPEWTPGELIDRLLLSLRDADRFMNAAGQVDAVMRALDEMPFSVITRLDDEWLDRVGRSSREAMMPWLYVLGDHALLQRHSVGIVGSRDATTRSLEITGELAGQVATRDAVVVSGGARGVDSVAHRTALELGGGTVVVLAQGIGTFAIPEHWWAWIERGQLAVVSEFFPFDQWESTQALQRNGTVARLSDAFVVIQAEVMSGTSSAGRSALRYQRPLYVIRQAGAGAEGFAGSEELIDAGGKPLPVDGSSPVTVDYVGELFAPRTAADIPPSQMRMF